MRARMIILGYEVGSTQVVVIGMSNWAQDPRETRRVQKRVQKEIKDTKKSDVYKYHCN